MFLLGAQANKISVHAKAISRLSPSLATLINGPFRESQEKVVRWKDVETPDFIRLCQFAYSGDYSPPRPLKQPVIQEDSSKENGHCEDALEVSDGSNTPAPEYADNEPRALLASAEPIAEDAWPLYREPKKRSGGKAIILSKQAKLRNSFRSQVFPYYNERNDPELLYDPVRNVEGEDFEPVLLGHARLYVLGEKYGIDDLMSITLHKLHKTLTLFQLYEHCIVAVVQLVQYIYENTLDSRTHPLRTITVMYVSAEIDTIGRSAEFGALLREGGDFVVDLWEMTQQKLL